MIDFSYPNEFYLIRRQRFGEFLRKLKLRPPENIDRKAREARIAELHAAIAENKIKRFGNYDNADWVQENYLSYAAGRISDQKDHTFYPRLFFIQIQNALLAQQEFKTVANFGAFFANVDATLALLQPERHFLAVDRGEVIQRLNRSIFCNANIEFIDADIEEVLKRGNVDLLAHCKTMGCLYPAHTEQIYRAAALAGVKCIIGVENTGYCQEIGDFYKFDYSDKPSVFYKSIMYAHNYPAMLRRAGYEITDGRVAYDGNNHAIVFTAVKA